MIRSTYKKVLQLFYCFFTYVVVSTHVYALNAPSVSASLSNGDDITVSWSIVADAAYYYRQVSINGGAWYGTSKHTSTSATYLNQSPRSYRFRVKACNAADVCSSYSSGSNTVTIYAKPATPSSPSASISNGNNINLSWGAVAGAAYYYRQVSVNGSGWYGTTQHHSTSVSYQNQTARSYRFRVKACNANNECSSYSSASNTVTILPVPSTPSAPIASVSNGDDINLSWSAINGAAYYYRQVSVDGGGWYGTTQHHSTSASYQNQAARSYRFRIKACNANNECSSYSSASNTVTILPVPSTPSAPLASISEGDDINLSWDAVDDATYYYRQVNVNDEGWYGTTQHTETNISYLDQSARSYRFRVKACNALNSCSPYSASSTPVTILPVPDSPPAPEAHIINDSDITISWDAVPGAAYYYRQVNVNNEGWYGTTKHTNINVLYENQSARSYRFKVSACNADDRCSPYSESSNEVVVLPQPVDIQGEITHEVNIDHIGAMHENTVIKWSVLDRFVNNLFTDYTLKIVSPDGDEDLTVSPLVDSTYIFNASNVGKWCFQVKATSNTGEGEFSDEVCVDITGENLFTDGEFSNAQLGPVTRTYVHQVAPVYNSWNSMWGGHIGFKEVVQLGRDKKVKITSPQYIKQEQPSYNQFTVGNRGAGYSTFTDYGAACIAYAHYSVERKIIEESNSDAKEAELEALDRKYPNRINSTRAHSCNKSEIAMTPQYIEDIYKCRALPNAHKCPPVPEDPVTNGNHRYNAIFQNGAKSWLAYEFTLENILDLQECNGCYLYISQFHYTSLHKLGLLSPNVAVLVVPDINNGTLTLSTRTRTYKDEAETKTTDIDLAKTNISEGKTYYIVLEILRGTDNTGSVVTHIAEKGNPNGFTNITTDYYKANGASTLHLNPGPEANKFGETHYQGPMTLHVGMYWGMYNPMLYTKDKAVSNTVDSVWIVDEQCKLPEKYWVNEAIANACRSR